MSVTVADLLCSKSNKALKVRRVNLLKQTETFEYLVSAMNAKDGCEDDVNSSIKAGWRKWKDLNRSFV